MALHPLIEEFCRASSPQPHFVRRVQRELRETIQPLIDTGNAAKEENILLKAEIERLKAEKPRKRETV